MKIGNQAHTVWHNIVELVPNLKVWRVQIGDYSVSPVADFGGGAGGGGAVRAPPGHSRL